MTLMPMMTVKLLQDDLDTLLNWSRIWKMSFNPSQCSYPSQNFQQTLFHGNIL